MPFAENSTVVVAHGAWADGSSWKEVILLSVNKDCRSLLRLFRLPRSVTISPR